MQQGLGQHIRLEQRMQMKMAPRMIQSMEILQLPIMALQERIEQEQLENPVLEVTEDGDGPPEPEPIEVDTGPTDEAPLEVDVDKDYESDFERLASLPAEWDDAFDAGPRRSRGAIEDAVGRHQDAEQNIAAKLPGLPELLLEQLRYVECPPEVRDLAEQIVQNLDDNGYLAFDPAALLGPGRFGPEARAVVDEALAIVQGLEPRGVAARDLSECLILQIDPDHPLADAMRAICRDHLQDVQQNRLPVIEKRTGLDMETIKEAIEAVRHLNPKPGAAYTVETVPGITPDVVLEETDDGYELVLNSRGAPRLHISRMYRDLLRGRTLDPKTREFLRRKMESARWLIESIEQRRHTLYRVAKAIMDYQHDFLDKGPRHIEPLKMQQIADRVGVHVTTVSRAVDGKYIQTPRGILPLKRFFGGGTTTASGDTVAWNTIKQQLVDLVEKEDKSAPYSDKQLVEEFAKRGVTIARRTITKYRKALDIADARRRKQY